jgi:hypothetical protein
MRVPVDAAVIPAAFLQASAARRRVRLLGDRGQCEFCNARGCSAARSAVSWSGQVEEQLVLKRKI